MKQERLLFALPKRIEPSEDCKNVIIMGQTSVSLYSGAVHVWRMKMIPMILWLYSGVKRELVISRFWDCFHIEMRSQV
jgi:hypothetical protein